MLGLKQVGAGMLDWSRLGRDSTGMDRQKQSGLWVTGNGSWVVLEGWPKSPACVKMRRVQ